jgi:hypothetical protein
VRDQAIWKTLKRITFYGKDLPMFNTLVNTEIPGITIKVIKLSNRTAFFSVTDEETGEVQRRTALFPEEAVLSINAIDHVAEVLYDIYHDFSKAAETSGSVG